MTEEDLKCPWYIGESTRESVEELLSREHDQTFVVFKPSGQSDSFMLAFKAYDTVNFKEILCRDGLYGFTEPLQFECIEHALDTFNSNEHSRFFGSLKGTIKRTQSMYRNPRKSDNPAPAILLKKLRETAKYRSEKDEEICELQNKIKEEKENLQNLSAEINALYNVLKTLEKQTEKHRELETLLRQNASEADRRELSDNYERISTRKAKTEEVIGSKEEEKLELEKTIYQAVMSNHKCRVEVKKLLSELQETEDEVLAIYPEFEEFIDNLLAEDTRIQFSAQPQDISKAASRKLLQDTEEGTFVIWNYNQQGTPYCISISSEDGPKHYPILQQDGYYGFDETTCIFETLQDLVMNYGKIPFRVHDETLGDLTLRHELTV